MLASPGSATTLAASLPSPVSRRTTTCRVLEEHGLVRLVEERQRRGLVERVMVATARSYALSPVALGDSGADPARIDRLSTRYLVAVAARMLREVGDLARRADRAGQPLPTLTIDTEIRFATAADRAAFTAELAETVQRLAGPLPRRGRPSRALAPPRRRGAPLARRSPHDTRPAPATSPIHGGTDMTDERPDRAIELEVTVEGTPEEVWRAIATGPGISSWYVPHEVDEREGGATVSSFGPGPEMQIAGRVAAWEPPNRVLFTGVRRPMPRSPSSGWSRPATAARASSVSSTPASAPATSGTPSTTA